MSWSQVLGGTHLRVFVGCPAAQTPAEAGNHPWAPGLPAYQPPQPLPSTPPYTRLNWAGSCCFLTVLESRPEPIMETQMALQSWRAIHFPVGWEEGQLYFPSSLGFLSDSGQHHES